MSDFTKSCEGFGRKRLEAITHNKSNPDKKIAQWKSEHKFPFKLNFARHFWIEYVVENFEAELGFFMDYLGLKHNALGDDYAVLTNPENDFYFGFWRKTEEKKITPPDTITIGFLVEDIFEKFEELAKRGIIFTEEPTGYPKKDDPLQVCKLKTPNKITVEIWGTR